MESLKRAFLHHLEGAWDNPNFAVNEILKLLNT